MNVILLGAGLSKRMGQQKLLLPFGDKSVIETVIDNLRSAGLGHIYAVLSREVAAALSPAGGLAVGVNEEPERGQSSSLKIGLDMLPAGEDFCIMLGDLPLARPADITALAARFAALPPEKSVLAPCRGGVFGHPICYRAIWRERFRGAEGDVGGKKILMKYEAEIERVTVPDRHFKDMDTPEEYNKLLTFSKK
ncbi:MAG: nucleotidyltransferase family protein [Synergistaceae bacterium]|nr:nucleotidyltransferase family protein [Synergistaceae bacterium]